MGTALITWEVGTAIIYGSGSLSSLAGLGGASSILVTRTGHTPAEDPVCVDLSSILGQLRGNCTITVQGGATVIVGGGGLNAGLNNRLVLNGGRLILRSTLFNVSAGSSITVGPQAGELRVEPQGLAVRSDLPVNFVDAAGQPTTAIPPGFTMDFPGTRSVHAVYDPGADRTTIGDGFGNGGLFSLGRVTVLQGDPFNLRSEGRAQRRLWPFGVSYSRDFTVNNGHDDGHGGVITCFLSGTLIRMREGSIPVESLSVGDEVAVFSADGRPQGVQRVRWVGQGHAAVRAGLPDDEAGWPVRFRRNALADGFPRRDLLVTAEHCLLMGGYFVPARMLVNGASISYDRGVSAYDYWHVEIEPHGIIEAEGVLTESYLDTGNRQGFVAQLGQWAQAGARSWEKDAAAPLGVSRGLVEPVYRILQARAGLGAGQEGLPVGKELVDDPDLTVLAPSGEALPLVRRSGQRYLFRFSIPCREVMLVSRASRPCDVIGPFVDDRRWLGVLVGRVLLFRATGTLDVVTSFLEAPQQEGWDVREVTPCRWTNGRARLVLPETGEAGVPLFLSIELLAGGPYHRQPGPAGCVRLGGGGSRVA